MKKRTLVLFSSFLLILTGCSSSDVSDESVGDTSQSTSSFSESIINEDVALTDEQAESIASEINDQFTFNANDEEVDQQVINDSLPMTLKSKDSIFEVLSIREDTVLDGDDKMHVIFVDVNYTNTSDIITGAYSAFLMDYPPHQETEHKYTSMTGESLPYSQLNVMKDSVEPGNSARVELGFVLEMEDVDVLFTESDESGAELLNYRWNLK